MSQKHWTREQIAEIVAQAKELGISYKDAAERFGIPLWRIYRHNCKSHNSKEADTSFSDQHKEHATDSSSDPTRDNHSDSSDDACKDDLPCSVSDTTVKSSLPEQVREIILDYKRQNPYCGFKRIEQYLRNTYFLLTPRKQIRQVLKEAGLLGLNDSSFDRNNTSETEPKGTRRFEARGACELYQMDITYVYITGLKVLYLINVIDDYSRFCLRSLLRFDQSADTLIEVLHDAIAEYGKPHKLLTDQGRAFYSWSTEKTKFQQYLDDMKIEHIVADSHSPTTAGKVERFHQTIKEELIRKVKFKDYADATEKIKAFVRNYNFQRPHQSLDGARPADRFMGIIAGKTLTQRELIGNELDLDKGYLLFKLGAHEVSMVLNSEKAPQIFVNGVLYIAKSSGDQLSQAPEV